MPGSCDHWRSAHSRRLQCCEWARNMPPCGGIRYLQRGQERSAAYEAQDEEQPGAWSRADVSVSLSRQGRNAEVECTISLP
jgi:hypothetical protein